MDKSNTIFYENDLDDLRVDHVLLSEYVTIKDIKQDKTIDITIETLHKILYDIKNGNL